MKGSIHVRYIGVNILFVTDYISSPDELNGDQCEDKNNTENTNVYSHYTSCNGLVQTKVLLEEYWGISTVESSYSAYSKNPKPSRNILL